MMGHLRNHFDIYALDMMGFGSSGRPQDVRFTDFESTMNYFIDSIFTWSQKANIGQNG